MTEERHSWDIFCCWFYFITEVESLDMGCNWKSPGWYHDWYCFGYTLYFSILSSILILIQYALLYLCLIAILTLSAQYYIWINISLWLNLLVFNCNSFLSIRLLVITPISIVLHSQMQIFIYYNVAVENQPFHLPMHLFIFLFIIYLQ